MTNKEVQDFLKQFPDNYTVRVTNGAYFDRSIHKKINSINVTKDPLFFENICVFDEKELIVK